MAQLSKKSRDLLYSTLVLTGFPKCILQIGLVVKIPNDFFYCKDERKPWLTIIRVEKSKTLSVLGIALKYIR